MTCTDPNDAARDDRLNYHEYSALLEDLDSRVSHADEMTAALTKKTHSLPRGRRKDRGFRVSVRRRLLCGQGGDGKGAGGADREAAGRPGRDRARTGPV